ncbi:MAG TPA: DEAD/DEAH box helicase [Kiritimatiellia bacterium]|nr:DEAD/DEAH box helicase [Kiritimatiellia bacterium]
MSGMDEVLAFLEQRFQSQIKSHQVIDPVEGAFAPFPDALHPNLRDALTSAGIPSLYAHQAEAFQTISCGHDTVLVSRTASGKTLSFFLPILNDYLSAPAPFSVMLLYPTKALSRDQEGALGRLMKAAGANRTLGTFDGDTPREERSALQRSADFIISNPDMLHSGILPNHHRGWKNFLSRLNYIVIDEVHTYRGAFGSHVSNVFRRLLRVCDMHGSQPRFICSSATVGNPGAHVQALFHRPFHVIDRDGAPRPRRDLYLLNPPLVPSPGSALYRKGTGSISVHLIRKAAEAGVRTICFCRARQEVERLYRSVIDGRPDLATKIKPYRGGLLPNERRALERDLFEGRLNTIITTNALELGIDIGDLDLCILSGHPGTIASFWQQAGRVGRKGSRAVIVYIARDTPIDQYLVNHPPFLTRAPIEQAWLSADNPYILLQHLPCAAHEHPLRPDEPHFSSHAYPLAVNVLADEKTIVPYHDTWRYALKDYPARGVNLRGMTDYNVEIHCDGTIIGEIDPIGARGTLYKDAIYQHLGRRYMSMDLNLDQKLCRVEEVAVDYYTEAVWEKRIEMTDVDQETQLHHAGIRFGYVHVNKQPKLYKKIRERSYENIGYGPITLPPFEYDTTGLALLPPPDWKARMAELDARYTGAALFGLSYLLRRAAPSLCMADENDIETDVAEFETSSQTYQSSLYLYDAHEGGVGYAEKIYDRLPDALALCRDIIDQCECESGCPSCVPPLPPGVNDEHLEELLIESNAAVACARSLLTALLEGLVHDPLITLLKRPAAPPITPPPEDEEQKKLVRRLEKSAGILRKKREREH